jgi:hypothetical protein
LTSKLAGSCIDFDVSEADERSKKTHGHW